MKSGKKKVPDFFRDGPLHPMYVAELIAFHSQKQNIGAHDIFLGQVRADMLEQGEVEQIHFEAFRPLADENLAEIREEMIQKHGLTCAHVVHSLGAVKTGELCFMVFVSAPHRQEAFEACREMVNRIKAEVPIFGKEAGESFAVWKENHP